MYGDDKEQFIKEYMRSKVVIETSIYAIFKRVAIFEEGFEKDAAEFTKDEILTMLKAFNSKSVNSLLNYVVILKHYSRWKTGTIGDNEYEEIGKNDVESLINKGKILTEEDIHEIEDQLLNWSDKAILLLLWIGVSGQSMMDIYTLSENNVDFENKIININGNEYPLTDRLAYVLPKAFDEDELMSYGTTMRVIPVKGKGRIYKERPNSLGVNTNDAVFRYFYRKIRIFREYLDISGLTMKDIQKFGLLHYLQLGMKECNLSLREFLRTKQGEKLAKRYGFDDYWVDSISSKYSQYL